MLPLILVLNSDFFEDDDEKDLGLTISSSLNCIRYVRHENRAVRPARKMFRPRPGTFRRRDFSFPAKLWRANGRRYFAVSTGSRRTAGAATGRRNPKNAGAFPYFQEFWKVLRSNVRNARSEERRVGKECKAEWSRE